MSAVDVQAPPSAEHDPYYQQHGEIEVDPNVGSDHLNLMFGQIIKDREGADQKSKLGDGGETDSTYSDNRRVTQSRRDLSPS